MLVEALSRREIVIHRLLENGFSSIAFRLNLQVLMFILLKSSHFILHNDIVKVLGVLLDLVNLAPVAIKNIIVAVHNLLFSTHSLAVKSSSVAIFNPLAAHVHRVNHVKLISFEVVDVGDETLSPGQLVDALVGKLLLLLQFHYAGLKQLLLFKNLLLFVNCLHHLGLGLASYHGEARLHELILVCCLARFAGRSKHVRGSRLVKHIHLWSVNS
jgi:hypothetical protein